MSKQTVGKTLLRNVIRHTDAHNKIQEEMDMWKMRDWEIQASHPQRLPDSACLSGHMHCDRLPRDWSRTREGVSEHDDREARYWSRKLYEFEANDPDRWGHSGFKELYPEEFENDSEKNGGIKRSGHRKLKKSKANKEACLSKRLKKSSRKKKKKKKRKEEEKHKKADGTSSDCSSDGSSAIKDKPRKKGTKSRRKNKKAIKSRERDMDSSSEDTGEEKTDRRTNRAKKRKHKTSDSELNSKKSRKNWKAVGEESSDDSSAD